MSETSDLSNRETSYPSSQQFSSAIARWETYRRRRHKTFDDRTDTFAREAQLLLEQCQECVLWIVELEDEQLRVTTPGTPVAERWRRIEILTVAFYYFAHRYLDILKDIFGISLNVKDIRLVRNKMLEHPDEKGGVMALNFGYDLPNGPVIKPFGAGERPSESGLYLHAKRLIIETLAKVPE
jgi:hypothetical protein